METTREEEEEENPRNTEVQMQNQPDRRKGPKKSFVSPAQRILKQKIGMMEDLGPHHKSIGIRKDPNGKCTGANVTDLIAPESTVRLVHVEYPGIVENPANAIRTMGGTIKISEVFHHPQKKLELRYRPADVFCNPVHGTGRTTVGLLIRVRRRKTKQPGWGSVHDLDDKMNLVNLDEGNNLQPEVLQTFHQQAKKAGNFDSTLSGAEKDDDNPFLNTLMMEEKELLKNLRIKSENDDHKYIEQDSKSELGTVKTIVKLPKGNFNPVKSNIKLETLGIVNKVYEFSGISDYQYLPTVSLANGEKVSIINNIFPGFGDPENEMLFDYEYSGESYEKSFFPFFLPIYLSRIDKPLPSLPKIYVNTSNELSSNVVGQDESVDSTRTRRSVYTHIMNFRPDQMEEDILETSVVPVEPFVQALEDAAKKFYDPKHLEIIRKLFEQRPIWTKLALQWETKYSTENLKYMLPCVAYFSINGPWRSLWIRFGYDPRKDKSAFAYQLIDFRFPLEYRGFLDVDKDDWESYHKFKPDKIPPKSQMFYQLCDVKIPEIQELEGALTVRLNKSDTTVCDPKHGYLDEDIMEFCRYCMSRCIEVRLHSLGKIPSVKLPQVKLEAGGSIPVNQLKVKPRKQPKKRIRQYHSGKGKQRKSTMPEVTQLRYEFSQGQDEGSTNTHSLTDYFEDDEMEEEEVELYGNDYEREEALRNLDDCFEDDEDDDDETGPDERNFSLPL